MAMVWYISNATHPPNPRHLPCSHQRFDPQLDRPGQSVRVHLHAGELVLQRGHSLQDAELEHVIPCDGVGDEIRDVVCEEGVDVGDVWVCGRVREVLADGEPSVDCCQEGEGEN